MALIPCMDCGKEISDSALRCPQCGCWHPTLLQRRADRAKTVSAASFFCALLLLIIVLVVVWFSTDNLLDTSTKQQLAVTATLLISVLVAIVVRFTYGRKYTQTSTKCPDQGGG